MKEGKKYMNSKKKMVSVIAVVLGLGITEVFSSTTGAAEQNENVQYLELGDSEEETAYKEFLDAGEYFSDVEDLTNVMYSVYDINGDKTKELIIKGADNEENKEEYFFYRYKDKAVKAVGSLENTDDNGESKLYYVKKEKEIAVSKEATDKSSYTLYKVGKKIKSSFSINKENIDDQMKYTLEDENGNVTDQKITEANWSEVEESLEEIVFYDLEVSSDSEFTEEQINVLKSSLGVPDDVMVTRCEVGKPWYWEGAGIWIVNVELYSGDDFLAGAAIDPDTLELEREIYTYDVSRMNNGLSTGQEENNSEVVSPDDETTSEETSEIRETVSKVTNLPYVGGNTYDVDLHWTENGGLATSQAIDSGILGTVRMDLDIDGEEEIFYVSYEESSEAPDGNAIYFGVIKKIGKSWNIISKQEVSCVSPLEHNGENNESSVFMRKSNGKYEIFYESYSESVIATGQSWLFRGFRMEETGLSPISETNNIYYGGSPIDEFWRGAESELNDYNGDAQQMLDNYCSLGFARPYITFGSMTVDCNSNLYQIVHINKKNALSTMEISQWIPQSNGQGTLTGAFKCVIEDSGSAVPEVMSEYENAQAVAVDASANSQDSTEYLLPDVANRYLEETEVTSFSLDQIQLAINEIFARHGRCFKTAEIDSYFRSKSWYQPDASKTDEQIVAEFNEYEKANEELLEKVREAKLN